MPKQLDFTNGLVRDWVPVTPSDSTDNLKVAQDDRVVGFVATGAGNLVVTNFRGVDRTFPIQAGIPIPFVDASRVKSTGTTATGIYVALI